MISGQFIVENRGQVVLSDTRHVLLVAGLIGVPADIATKFASVNRSLRLVQGVSYDDMLSLQLTSDHSTDVAVSKYTQHGPIGHAFEASIWRI